MPTPQKTPPALFVTLGLLDGTDLVGVIPRFSPQQIDVELQVGDPDGPHGPTRLVPGEKIAYVAFHRDNVGNPVPAAQIKLKTLRIHAAGGRQFVVAVSPPALGHMLGFFAKPSPDDGPFEQIFFYSHGVSAKEDVTPLGELLVKNGAIGAAAMQQGLRVQDSERCVPIGQILIDQHNVDPEAVAQAAELQQRKHMRIGELLVDAGWITKDQLDLALAEQGKRKGKRIGQIIVELGVITEEALCSALAGKFMLPLVDLDQYPIDPKAAYEIPKEIIAKFGVLPIKSTDKVLTLAIGDPLAVDAIEEVRLRIRKRVEEVMTVTSQLRRHVIETLARFDSESEDSGLEQLLKDIELEGKEDEKRIAQLDKNEVSESDSTVIRLVNRVIVDAFRRGASDIHVEPYGDEVKMQIRLRVDGECFLYQELPSALRRPIVARLKIMANLDISERRKPQDGKIRFHTRTGHIELRVATIPTVNDNEDIVMRILASSKPLAPEAMRYSARNLIELTKLIAKPYGLFLVVGPTGSGKTTTLHSILGSLNSPKRKIWTAEDPVEITQAGLRQVQVQAKIGLTFAAALRSFLRADPDIIMVGEMRDLETASIAAESSLTGHLVFSTLHTNSAPETITRLVDMGLDPFSFADALIGVLAQRLARSLCVKCKASRVGTEREFDEFRTAYGEEAWDKDIKLALGPDFKLWHAPGCEACGRSGYKGRVALHELLTATDPLRSAIGHKAPVEQLRAIAQESGMTTLLQDGLQKALAGVTDLQQVLAVCSR